MAAFGAIALVLTSGGLMVATGALVADGHAVAAGPVSLAAGAIALTGFALGRRAQPPRQAQRSRLRWRPFLGAIALSYVAGAIMFAAGYVGAKGYWYAWPFIAALAAPTILASYALDVRARRS